MIPGKFLTIFAKDCQLCIGSEGNSAVLCHPTADEDHQVWYYDVSSQTIRCKANDLCLTTECCGELKLTNYDPDKHDVQGMCIENDKIVLKDNSGRALKAIGKNSGSGLCLEDCSSDETCWQFSNLELKMYYLEASNGLVLATENEVREPGTHVVLAQRQSGRPYHQLWYEDENSNLKCCHNHLVLDASQTEMTLEHDENNPEQTWVLYGETVSLRHDLTRWLTALDPNLSEGSRVGVADRADSIQQKWNRVYIE